MQRFSILFISIFCFGFLQAEDGYKLWLRYDPVTDPQLLVHYNKSIRGFMIEGSSSTLLAAGEELKAGLSLMLGTDIPQVFSSQKAWGNYCRNARRFRCYCFPEPEG